MLVGWAPSVIGGGKAPPSLSYLTEGGNSANQSSYTFSSLSFGAAASDRYIIAVVGSYGSSTGRTLNSLTIGGVTATKAAEAYRSSSGSTGICALCIAAVPTGTSGNVVATFNNTMQRAGVQLYRVTGLDSATPFHTGSSTSIFADVSSLSINIPDKGFVIAGLSYGGNDITSFSGVSTDNNLVVESTDQRLSCGSASNLAAQTGRTISASPSWTGNFVAASWL